MISFFTLFFIFFIFSSPIPKKWPILRIVTNGLILLICSKRGNTGRIAHFQVQAVQGVVNGSLRPAQSIHIIPTIPASHLLIIPCLAGRRSYCLRLWLTTTPSPWKTKPSNISLIHLASDSHLNLIWNLHPSPPAQSHNQSRIRKLTS